MARTPWQPSLLLSLLLSLVAGAALRERDVATLACDVERAEWHAYHEAFDAAARATASTDDSERGQARAALASALLERTANVSDVLTCNVGVVAGYYLIARLAAPLSVESFGLAGVDEAGLPYRLLQLALIFIFTLRNANKIPAGPGVAWGISEKVIIPAIMQMKKGQDDIMRNRLRGSIPVVPSFRDPSLRIAVVSICAYPEDHPLALPRLTPDNRDFYTSRHGYALRLHMESPILGAHGLGMQHAKLATILAYLQSGEFDWVAWFDCDSFIMNMNRTLDSIIYQYTQRSFNARTEYMQTDEPARQGGFVCGEAELERSTNLAGVWIDSWVPEDLQQEGAVHIEQHADGSLTARARQFGEAGGSLEESSDGDGQRLVLDFPDGPLQGRIVVMDGTEQVEWDNGAIWSKAESTTTAPSCREPCRELGSDECNHLHLDPEVDLLITEEGWGLSSANWLIRNSAWSRMFLQSALNAAHAELNLFGDQDAMILHLMNEQALRAASVDDVDRKVLLADPLDRHASVVPQFELNAYDALNALTMDCDAFTEGDFLVTFPQCKDAEGCNDVFNLAAEYASDSDHVLEVDAGAWWRRWEGAPRWPRYSRGSSSALRVFGPRPVIREVFLQERNMM